ncbi:hypothetical protein D9M72_544650 [compost metagenome]
MSVRNAHLQGPDVTARPDARTVVWRALLRPGNAGVFHRGHRRCVGRDHPPGSGPDGHPPPGHQFGLEQFDGASGAKRGGQDFEVAARNQSQDLVAQPGHPDVVPRRVPLQAVRHDPGRGRHVLFMLVPGALGMNRGTESSAAQ